MAFQVVMPRLGWTMEKGTLVEWRKRPGEYVQAGDILLAVESDKAIQEVEAVESGILHIPPESPAPGTEVAVGTVLAYLVPAGEELPSAAAQPAATAAPGRAGPAAAVSAPAARAGPSGAAPPISPRARRVARELGVQWQALRGSGRTGRIVERDVRRAAAQPTPPGSRAGRAAPAAQIWGHPMEQAGPEAAAPPVTPAPLPRARQTTVARVTAGAHATATATLTSEVDATETVRLRRAFAQDSVLSAGPRPGYTDILVRVVAQALGVHPALNARLEGEGVVLNSAVHVGIAVDSGRGLCVPVLRDVQGKGLQQIAAARATLVERARIGALGPGDLSGGTFTIVNLGIFEIDSLTRIIDVRECAILGMGRIVPKQVIVDADAGRLEIRHMAFLSLTFDHRLVDGALAARFLQCIKHLIEQPALLLTT